MSTAITKESHGGTGAFIGALAGLPAGPAAVAIMATGGAIIGNAAYLSAADDFNKFANNINLHCTVKSSSLSVSLFNLTNRPRAA
jgi:hypothetical protein